MKRLLLALLAALAALGGACARSAPAPAPSASLASVHGFYFDTVIEIRAACGEALLEEALALCAHYDALLGKTEPQSEVYRLNHAEGRELTVSRDLIEILQTARAVSEASHGMFDVSVGPLTALWDFKAESPSIPDAQALREAAKHVDYRNIEIDAENSRVRIPAGMQLDLGGVAKGYISAKVAAFLREKGVERALINLGGNIVTLGDRPGGGPWRIGIRDPWGGPTDYIGALACTNAAIVTSGVYERGFTLGGVRYHHILDPKSGMPVQSGLMQVSVHCADAALADALASAALALGPTEGLALIKSFGAEGCCIAEDGSMEFTEGFDMLTQ